MPVYQLTDRYKLTWSLYRRTNGQWVLDYNSIDNSWSGTVAYATNRNVGLMQAKWNKASYVVKVAAVLSPPPSSPPTPPPPPPKPPSSPEREQSAVYIGGSVPYASRTAGKYTSTSRTYAGARVYTRKDQYNLVWSLYRRGGSQWSGGRWVLDFNSIDTTWAGTVAYSTNKNVGVFDAKWNRASMVVSKTPVASFGALPGDDDPLPSMTTEPEHDDETGNDQEVGEPEALKDVEEEPETPAGGDKGDGNPTDSTESPEDKDSPSQGNEAAEVPPMNLTMIIGTAVGGVLALLAAIVAVVLCRRKKRKVPETVIVNASVVEPSVSEPKMAEP